MKDSLDTLLCERYPKIFRDRHAPMSETCMCWGFPGDGWFTIIDALCDRIQSHIDQHEETRQRNIEWMAAREAALNGDRSLAEKVFSHYKDEAFRQKTIDEMLGEVPHWRMVKPEVPQVVAAQVKEKFGTLRFYFDGGDDYVRGLVAMAESMSTVTCEECGNPGKQRGGRWIQTLCDEHVPPPKADEVSGPFDANRS
jgi:hypothetical protein